MARHEAGIYTLDLDGGTFDLVTKNDADLPECHGTYATHDGRVTFVNTDCGRGTLFTATATFANDELRFDDVEAADAAVAASFGGAPWARLH